MEAMQVGLPIVAFEGGGGFEGLVSEAGGMLVPMEDTHALSKAILTLANSKEHRERCKDLSTKIINERFSFEQYVFDLLHWSGISIPRISVIVPNYNYANHIIQRLDSICRQTELIYELIVLDDASSDNSAEIIEKYLEQTNVNGRLIVNKHNSGSVFRQWRKGIEQATGDLIWIAEADDLSEPDFLKALAPVFNDPSVSMAYCQSKQIDKDGNVLEENYLAYTGQISDIWENDYVRKGCEEIQEAHCIKNTIPNVSAVLFRRSALLRALDQAGDSLFDYKVAGDWLIYLYVLMQGKIYFCSKSLNLHRRHDENVTNSTKKTTHIAEVRSVQKIAHNFVSPSDQILAEADAYIEHLYDYFKIKKTENNRQ
jgi:glycosyltransferase involved in cell wall biosynthesis